MNSRPSATAIASNTMNRGSQIDVSPEPSDVIPNIALRISPVNSPMPATSSFRPIWVEVCGMNLTANANDRDAHRDVDQEDPAPRPVGDEYAAEDRADDAAEREDAAEQPQRAIARAAVLVGDDPGRGRHERAAAQCLQRPQRHQFVDAGRQAAQQRGGGEDGNRDQEDALATELLAQYAGDRHRDDLPEGVDGDRPAAPVDPGVQVVLQRRQRGGDDGSDRSSS